MLNRKRLLSVKRLINNNTLSYHNLSWRLDIEVSLLYILSYINF